MINCPYCKEEIQEGAIRCKYCTSMLISQEDRSHNTEKFKYVLDSDTMKFAKFAAGIFGMFTIVGLFLFGFNLKDMAKQLSDARTSLTQSETKLAEVLSRLETGLEKLSLAEKKVDNLQSETEALKQKANQAFLEIAQREVKSKELLLAIETRSGGTLIQTVTSEKAIPRSKISTLWTNGAMLRIAFIGGERSHHLIVKNAASEWARYANLKFEFGTDIENAEIRISFKKGDGSWSYVGTDALKIPPSNPTMNLDPSWSPDEIRTSALSRFGYVIGLLKEHQNPNAKIPWNKEAAYSFYMGAPHFLTKEQIDLHLFGHWPPGYFPFAKEYDTMSIMHQKIPNEITIGDFEVNASNVLSEGDKAWVARLYPR